MESILADQQYEDDIAWRLSLVDDPENASRLDRLATSVEATTTRISGALASSVGAMTGKSQSDTGKLAGSIDKSVKATSTISTDSRVVDLSFENAAKNVEKIAVSMRSIRDEIEKAVKVSGAGAAKTSATSESTAKSATAAPANAPTEPLSSLGKAAPKEVEKSVAVGVEKGVDKISKDDTAKEAKEPAYVPEPGRAYFRGKYYRSNDEKGTVKFSGAAAEEASANISRRNAELKRIEEERLRLSIEEARARIEKNSANASGDDLELVYGNNPRAAEALGYRRHTISTGIKSDQTHGLRVGTETVVAWEKIIPRSVEEGVARGIDKSRKSISDDPRLIAANKEYEEDFRQSVAKTDPFRTDRDGATENVDVPNEDAIRAVNEALEQTIKSGEESAARIAEIDAALAKIRPTTLGEVTKASGKAVSSLATLGKGIAQIIIASGGGKIGDDFVKSIVKIEGAANVAIGLFRSFDTVTKAGQKLIGFFSSGAERAKLQRDRLVELTKSTREHAEWMNTLYEASKAAGIEEEKLIEIREQLAMSTKAAAKAQGELSAAEASTGKRGAVGSRGLLAGSVGSLFGGVVRDQVGGNAILEKIGDKIGDAVEKTVNNKGRNATAATKRLLRRTKAGRGVLRKAGRLGRLARAAGGRGAAGALARQALVRGGAAVGTAGAIIAASAAAAVNVADSFYNGKSLSEGGPAKYLGGKLFDIAKASGQGYSPALGVNVAELVKKDEKLSSENLARSALANLGVKIEQIVRQANFRTEDVEFSASKRLSRVDSLAVGDRPQREAAEARSESDRIRAEQKRVEVRNRAGLISDSDSQKLLGTLESNLKQSQAKQDAAVTEIVNQQKAELGRQVSEEGSLREKATAIDKDISELGKSESGQDSLQRKVDLQRQIEDSLRQQIETIRNIESTQRAANNETIAQLRQTREELKANKEAAEDAATAGKDKLASTLVGKPSTARKLERILDKDDAGEDLTKSDLRSLRKSGVDSERIRDLIRKSEQKLLEDKGIDLDGLNSRIFRDENKRAKEADAGIAAADAGLKTAEQRDKEIGDRADKDVKDRLPGLKDSIEEQRDAEKILIQTQVQVQIEAYYKDLEAQLRKTFEELGKKDDEDIKKLVTKLVKEYQAKDAQANRNT